MTDPQLFSMGHHRLPAVLRVPQYPKGLVVFAHGSGSGHRSPRNNQVAESLTAVGFAILLFDLLTFEEERDRTNVFDIGLLSDRLVAAMIEIGLNPGLARLPIGLFGASTGGGAALRAASQRPDLVRAVVSRGGRPDLAGREALESVACPTLLILGANDRHVIELNRAAASLLHCPHEIVLVPGAGHLFEEPGAMMQVIGHAIRWFETYLPAKQETVV